MRVPPFLPRHEFGNIVFDRARRFAKREPQSMRDAKNVRINRKRRILEGNGHHDVCRLAADAG